MNGLEPLQSEWGFEFVNYAVVFQGPSIVVFCQILSRTNRIQLYIAEASNTKFTLSAYPVFILKAHNKLTLQLPSCSEKVKEAILDAVLEGTDTATGGRLVIRQPAADPVYKQN